MTDPSEVVVSDEDAQRFLAELGMRWRAKNSIGVVSTKIALAAFIAKRVPDAPPQDNGECAGVWHDGFNACRAKVLTGK